MDLNRFPINCLNIQTLEFYLFSKNLRAFYYQIFHEQVEGYIKYKNLLLEIGGAECIQNLTSFVLKCFSPLM